MKTARSTTPVRERILETACDLFYRQGYRATGINQIIAESGVAKASFYDHFSSKDTLLEAYVEEMSRREMEDLREQVLSRPTAEARFFAPLEILMPWFEESDYRGCPFQNAVAELPADDRRVHRAIRAHQDASRALFRELAADYIAEMPALKKADEVLLADMYLVLFTGAVALTAAVRAPWPVERAREGLESHLRMLARGS